MNEGINSGVKDQKEEAISEIMRIRQEVYMMGGNDFEIPYIDDLLERLKNGECTPEFAIEEASNIRGSKSNYH